jgi:hypothetical protein
LTGQLEKDLLHKPYLLFVKEKKLSMQSILQQLRMCWNDLFSEHVVPKGMSMQQETIAWILTTRQVSKEI